MGTSIALRNVVGEAQDAFVKTVIPLHGDFNSDAVIPLKIKVENRVDGRLVMVQVFDEGTQTTLVLEQFLFARALIYQIDTHA